MLRNASHKYDNFLCSQYDYFMILHISEKNFMYCSYRFFFCSQKSHSNRIDYCSKFFDQQWKWDGILLYFFLSLSLSLSLLYHHKTQFVFTRFQEDKDRISGTLFDSIFIVSILSKEFCSCKSLNFFQKALISCYIYIYIHIHLYYR